MLHTTHFPSRYNRSNITFESATVSEPIPAELPHMALSTIATIEPGQFALDGQEGTDVNGGGSGDVATLKSGYVDGDVGGGDGVDVDATLVDDDGYEDTAATLESGYVDGCVMEGGMETLEDVGTTGSVDVDATVVDDEDATVVDSGVVDVED